jgi:hypothetical protein
VPCDAAVLFCFGSELSFWQLKRKLSDTQSLRKVDVFSLETLKCSVKSFQNLMPFTENAK